MRKKLNTNDKLKAKITPQKSLGQNFLVNPGIVAKIIKAAELKAEDTILEVGPGTGNLTRALIETGARVIAIEKDRRLIEDLEAGFSSAQIEIIEGDILKFQPNKHGFVEGEYKIIANLPYYITSHFIRMALETWPTPSLVVLMVQKEVARRIISKPPEMNLLALSVQYYAQPKIIAYVSRGSFRPEPNVDSAIIKLIPRSQHPLPVEKEKLFFSIIKAAFSGKRKQLLNTLPEITGLNKADLALALQKAGIKPQTRPETIDLASWLAFVNVL